MFYLVFCLASLLLLCNFFFFECISSVLIFIMLCTIHNMLHMQFFFFVAHFKVESLVFFFCFISKFFYATFNFCSTLYALFCLWYVAFASIKNILTMNNLASLNQQHTHITLKTN